MLREFSTRFLERFIMRGIKQAIHELADSLPEDCAWEDAMYRLYVQQKIVAGIRDVDDGRVVPHEEVFKEWQD